MISDLISSLKARHPNVPTDVLSEIAAEAVLAFVGRAGEVGTLVARGGGDASPWSVAEGGSRSVPFSAKGGGDALPWTVITTTTREALDLPTGASLTVQSNVEQTCRDLAHGVLAKGEQLPAEKSFSLFLIRALIEGTASGKPALGVAFPPEFLFVLDVGYESLVGVSFTWSPVLYGDPTFPDKSRAAIRSIRALDHNSLVYPDDAGSLIIRIADGVPEDRAADDLGAHGLWGTKFSGSICFARCPGFRERSICSQLTKALTYVMSAEPSRIVRIIDFVPGWSVVRLV